MHNSEQVSYPVHSAPTTSSNGMDKLFTVPDTFYMILDLEAGTLGFLVDNQFLGVAHKGK